MENGPRKRKVQIAMNNIMDPYTREGERLRKLFEEDEGDEAFSDSDVSVADADVSVTTYLPVRLSLKRRQ
ncbi:hypothetical protein JTB14_024490 [Gonioctena quinquepunctata]|nr:hypothetical protein JTB14_024490 [Gonioctena quinquepunctata]